MTPLKKMCSLSPSSRTRCCWALADMTPIFPVRTQCRRKFLRTRGQKDTLPGAQTLLWCWSLTRLPNVSSVLCGISFAFGVSGSNSRAYVSMVFWVQFWVGHLTGLPFSPLPRPSLLFSFLSSLLFLPSFLLSWYRSQVGTPHTDTELRHWFLQKMDFSSWKLQQKSQAWLLNPHCVTSLNQSLWLWLAKSSQSDCGYGYGHPNHVDC